MSPEARSPAELFRPLPWAERLFVRARMRTAPLGPLAARAPAGRIADIGCGHGALVALLATQGAERRVVGVDPDPRKVEWARASVGRLPNVELRVGTAESLASEAEGSFDAVAVADVLYLLPVEGWEAFLGACRRLLRPGGVLLLKEAEADGSWRHLKCLAQEAVMVRLLRRTHSSGGLQFQPRGFTQALLERVGFGAVTTQSLARGYTTPHVLFEARSPG